MQYGQCCRDVGQPITHFPRQSAKPATRWKHGGSPPARVTSVTSTFHSGIATAPMRAPPGRREGPAAPVPGSSGMPPVALATTGTPAASASRTATGCPSVRPARARLGCTNSVGQRQPGLHRGGRHLAGQAQVDAPGAGQRGQRHALVALAQDHQGGTRGRRQPRHRPHQHVVALDGDQAADGQHDRAVQAAGGAQATAARRRPGATADCRGPASSGLCAGRTDQRPGSQPCAGQPAQAGAQVVAGQHHRRWSGQQPAGQRPAAGQALQQGHVARVGVGHVCAGGWAPRRRRPPAPRATASGSRPRRPPASRARMAGSSPPQNRAACSAARSGARSSRSGAPPA